MNRIFLVIFKLNFEISVAGTTAEVCFAMATAMAPDPVHGSHIFNIFFVLFMYLIAFSANNTVSESGCKTCSFINISHTQKIV